MCVGRILLFLLWLAVLSYGRTPEEILRLVGRHEDLSAWAGRPGEEVHRWLRKGIRFDGDDEALVAKFHFAKLVLLANLHRDRTDPVESVPATSEVLARVDLEAAKTQLRQFVKEPAAGGYGGIGFAAWHLYLLDGDIAFLDSFRAPLERWIQSVDADRDPHRLDASGRLYLEMLSLAEIDDALDRPAEAILWRRRAAALRSAVNRSLWDADSASYYERDARGGLVKRMGDVLLRALNCGLPDIWMVRAIFDRHILNPKEFWTPCPLPSLALNGSGSVVALTHLRAPYGFEYYGRGGELRDVQRRFLAAVVRNPATFERYHPVSGQGGPGAACLSSPTAAFVLDAVGRLYGVLPRGVYLEWNLPSTTGAHWSEFEMDLAGATYRLECKSGACAASVDGRRLFSLKGPAIVYTDRKGRRITPEMVRDFPRN